MEREGPPNDLSLNPDSSALHVSDGQRFDPQSGENSTPFDEESLKTNSESSFVPNPLFVKLRRMDVGQQAGEDTNNSSGANELRDQTNNQD